MNIIQQAKLQLEAAENFFQNSTGDDVDIAIMEVDLAKLKLNKACKIAKQEGIGLE